MSNNMISTSYNSLRAMIAMCRRARHDAAMIKSFPQGGETIYCVGNGPSLRTQDLSFLNGQHCLLTNRAYMILDRFTPAHCATVFTDADRILEIAPGLLKDQPNMPIYFSLNTLDPKSVSCLRLLPEACFLKPKIKICRVGCIPGYRVDYKDGFSKDPASFVYTGYSVIFSAIQLAAYFGAKRIVCLGIDMNYTGDPQKDNLVVGAPSIFSFNYETHAKGMFITARDALASMGIELLDATPNGRVDVLEKIIR